MATRLTGAWTAHYRTISAAASATLVEVDLVVDLKAIPSGGTTVTLLGAAASGAGEFITVTNSDGTCSPTNPIILSCGGGDTINGATSITLVSAYTCCLIRTDGVSRQTALPAISKTTLDLVQKNGGTTPSYTVALNDVIVDYIAVPNSDVTVTLPLASAAGAGRVIYVINSDGSCSAAANINVIRSGADTVNGGTGFSLILAYASLMLVSNGVSKWTRVQG